MARRNLVEPLTLTEERLSGREYQMWLVDLSHMHDYHRLFNILHGIEFTWVHPFDENRAEEGIALRYRFTQDEFDSAGRNRRGHPYRASMEDYPCSVMEMLIALAISIEDSIMYDPAKGDRTHVWLWTMLQNLELAQYSDSYLGRLSKHELVRAYSAVKRSISVFMEREYAYDGTGGLFPIKNPPMDQRHEEIWYQANIYAIEELGL